jgi:Zn-dependent alcohol dehydrogenase
MVAFSNNLLAEYAIVSRSKFSKKSTKMFPRTYGTIQVSICDRRRNSMNTLILTQVHYSDILCWSVGLSALMAAKIAGCRTIIAVDLQRTIELAKELALHIASTPKKWEDVKGYREK